MKNNQLPLQKGFVLSNDIRSDGCVTVGMTNTRKLYILRVSNYGELSLDGKSLIESNEKFKGNLPKWINVIFIANKFNETILWTLDPNNK